MTTSFRQELRAGCKSVLDTYQAAHPDQLNKVYDYPPESFDTPAAYVEKTVNERIEHDASLRRRVLTVNVVLVNKLMSNDQATGEQDVLVDGLLDAFTAAPHGASTTTEIQPVSVTDTEITAGEGVRYAAAVIAIEGSTQEGRL
jgi:hypothetical protein